MESWGEQLVFKESFHALVVSCVRREAAPYRRFMPQELNSLVCSHLMISQLIWGQLGLSFLSMLLFATPFGLEEDSLDLGEHLCHTESCGDIYFLLHYQNFCRSGSDTGTEQVL